MGLEPNASVGCRDNGCSIHCGVAQEIATDDIHQLALQLAYATHKYWLANDEAAERAMNGDYRESDQNVKNMDHYAEQSKELAAKVVALHQELGGQGA